MEKNRTLRQDAETILREAVRAVLPEAAVRRALAGQRFPGKIYLVAAGKAAYRMAKAAELLKLTELSISDIGNAVGYPNQLHFSRAFKNVYGVSPREWRNKNQMIR